MEHSFETFLCCSNKLNDFQEVDMIVWSFYFDWNLKFKTMQSNEIFLYPTVDPSSVEFVMNTKGHLFLIYQGYHFLKTDKSKSNNYWRCSKRKKLKCKVTIAQDVESNKFRLTNLLPHNHLPPPDEGDDFVRKKNFSLVQLPTFQIFRASQEKKPIILRKRLEIAWLDSKKLKIKKTLEKLSLTVFSVEFHIFHDY